MVGTVVVCMGPGETSRKSRKPHFLVSPRKKDDDMTTTTTMGSPLLSSLHNGMFHVARVSWLLRRKVACGDNK